MVKGDASGDNMTQFASSTPQLVQTKWNNTGYFMFRVTEPGLYVAVAIITTEDGQRFSDSWMSHSVELLIEGD